MVLRMLLRLVQLLFTHSIRYSHVFRMAFLLYFIVFMLLAITSYSSINQNLLSIIYGQRKLNRSGWDSSVGRFAAGVPMICWPFFADQQMNCRYICNEWGVGIEMDNNAKREEVEKLVRELMEGENDKKMREKVMD